MFVSGIFTCTIMLLIWLTCTICNMRKMLFFECDFLIIKYDKITHVADHKTIPLQLLGLSSGQLHEIKFRSNWYLLISFHARL